MGRSFSLPCNVTRPWPKDARSQFAAAPWPKAHDPQSIACDLSCTHSDNCVPAELFRRQEVEHQHRHLSQCSGVPGPVPLSSSAFDNAQHTADWLGQFSGNVPYLGWMHLERTAAASAAEDKIHCGF